MSSNSAFSPDRTKHDLVNASPVVGALAGLVPGVVGLLLLSRADW